MPKPVPSKGAIKVGASGKPKADFSALGRAVKRLFVYYPRMAPLTMCCILFSAAVAAGLIALIYTKLLEQLGPQAIVMFGVSLVPADFLIKNLIIIFMALGLSIGAAGSIVSMRRFLDNRDRA